MNKDEARDILANATVNAVTIENEVHVFVGDNLGPQIEQTISKGLKAGKRVTHNGVSQWITHEAILDRSKQGSDMFTWDKNGNRVKQNKILVTIDTDGTRSEQVIGTVYKNW